MAKKPAPTADEIRENAAKNIAAENQNQEATNQETDQAPGDQDDHHKEPGADKISEGLQDAREKAHQDDSDDGFQDIDTGDFLIHDWKQEPTLIAEWTGVTSNHPLTNKDGSPKEMLSFKDRQGQRVLVDHSYQLTKLLVHRQSETQIDWTRRIEFKLTRTGSKDIGGGQTVSTFVHKFRYL